MSGSQFQNDPHQRDADEETCEKHGETEIRRSRISEDPRRNGAEKSKRQSRPVNQWHIASSATAPCVAGKMGVGKSAIQVRLEGERGFSFDGGYRPPDPSGGERLRFARFIYVAAAGAALSACATPTITRSCLTQAQYEQLKASEPPKVHNKLTGKADEDVRPLAGSALELRAWGHAMLDTLKICSTP